MTFTNFQSLIFDLNRTFEEILDDLRENEHSYRELFSIREMEIKGKNRKEVLIAITRLLDDNKNLDKTSILSAVRRIETRSRRRFVGRVYSKGPIWALETIRKRYPDYSEEQLREDILAIGKRKKKHSKPKGVYFRISQVGKLWNELKIERPDSKRYNWLCNRIAWHQDRLKRPIQITVRLGQKMGHYDFSYKTSEQAIKYFASLIARKDITWDDINKVYGLIRARVPDFYLHKPQ